MSSSWNIDLENGPHKSTFSAVLPSEPSSSPQCTALGDIKLPLPGSSAAEAPHVPSYGDRLVSNYLAPRPHPKFDNMNYDDTIIQGKRFRHMNIARIQHDLLRLQHVLTSPGGGTNQNFASLSSLLHEHGILNFYILR
jgi:hypothetical protein